MGDVVPRDADVITAVEGKPVRLDDDLGRILGRYDPNDTVALEVYRDGKKRIVRVKLGTRPDSP